jgi:hypothetical protein
MNGCRRSITQRENVDSRGAEGEGLSAARRQRVVSRSSLRERRQAARGTPKTPVRVGSGERKGEKTWAKAQGRVPAGKSTDSGQSLSHTSRY